MEPSENSHASRAPDPKTLQVPRIAIPVHRLTRYLRAGLEVIDGMLRWHMPRTLLGVVPIGVRHISLPVADVRSLAVHRVVRPFNLLVGAACIAAPLVFGLWWAVAPMVTAGLWLVLVSLGPRLELATRTGAKHHASLCFSHQIDAELYMAAVREVAEEARQGQ